MQRASAYPGRWLGFFAVLLLTAIGALTLPTRSSAQVPTPQLDENASGTYYIVAFPDTTSNKLDVRYPNNRVRFEASLWMYSAVKNKVKVTGYGGASTVLNLEPNQFKVYTLTGSPIIDVINTVSRNTFKVEADYPIVLYCYIADIQANEAWTPIPVENWGTDYFAACVPGEVVNEIGTAGETEVPSTPKPAPGEILVMAAYDNTKVSILPPAGIGFVGGPPKVITLNAGEAYQVQSYVDTSVDADHQDDIGGSTISADKPVGVLSGDTRVQVVYDEVGLKNNAYKDMLMEWIPPVDVQGQDFVYLPTWDNHRPGIGASAERKREFARIYNTTGQPKPITGYYFTPGGSDTVKFSIKRDTLGEFAFGQPTAVYFHTDEPAMAMMHSSAIVKFDGSTPCFRNIPCMSYSAWAPYMVEMVPRQQWTKFAPYYAPTNPGNMLNFVSVVTDTASARNIIMQDGSKFLFNRPIPGTDLVWGTRPINPGIDYWLMGLNDSARFYGSVFGLVSGSEAYRPGGTKKKDDKQDAIAGGGGIGIPEVQHPCEYEEYNALAYGYPLAPSRRVLKPADTLQIDTTMDCSVLTIKIRAINASPVGLRSITLDPTTVKNAKLTPVDPLLLSDIIGKSSCTVQVQAIDPLQNADATVIIKDRTGHIWTIPFHYEAEYVVTSPDKILDFGTVNLGATVQKTVTIVNPLTRPITVKDIALAVGHEFQIVDIQPNKPQTQLQPGDTMVVTVSVTPSQDNQLYVDTLKITLGCTKVPVVLQSETTKPCIFVSDLPFGQFTVNVDGPKQLDLKVCNVGSGTLTFANPPVTWTDPNYSIDPAELATLASTQLKANDCFTLHVTFTPPATPGEYDITAQFHTNATCNRDTSVWTATVTKPGPRITGYDWKQQWVTTSNTCTKDSAGAYSTILTLDNLGDQDVIVQSVVLAGQDATDGYFKLDNSDPNTTTSSGDVLRQNQQNKHLQKVLFMPKDERAYSCQVLLICQINGSFMDTVSNTLSGIGIESHGAISGNLFDPAEFKGPGSVNENGIVYLIAKQTRPLTVTGIQVDNPADFGVDLTGITLPQTLQPGDTLAVPVIFHPQVPGYRTTKVSFLGDQSNCDDPTNLMKGYTFTRGVTVSNLDFGNRLSCATDSGNVTITNTGSEAVIVTNATLDDQNKPPVFDLPNGINAVLDTLQPGESKNLVVHFAPPLRVGSFSAQVLFDVINIKDSGVIATTPAQITLSTYIVTVHAAIDKNYRGAPGATIETPVVLQDDLAGAGINKFFIGVLYDNTMMKLTNGSSNTNDIASMLNGTLVQDWTLQIVESDQPEGEYLAVLTAPPGKTLQGTGKLLNPKFQLFLGTTDSSKISFYILPVGNQCARIIPSPGLARVDSVCGLNLRLIESSGFNYSLNQNKPNPFNPTTDITFSLGLDGPTTLTLYDASGRKVATLVDGVMQPGTYQVTWDATGFPSGLYYYRLQSGVWTQTNTMILRK